MVSTLIVSVSSKFNVWFDFYFILIEIKIKFPYYVCCIFHLLWFEYALFFIFSSLKVRFFHQGQWFFFAVNTIEDWFFMIFFDNLITHERDLSFGLQSPMSATCRLDCSRSWTFTPQPLIFAIWRVARCLPGGSVILFGGTSGRRY